MKDKSIIAIVILLLVPVFVMGILYSNVIPPMLTQNTTDTDINPVFHDVSEEPIEPSNPTNVVIRESAVYDAPKGDDRPIVHFEGIVYWEELSGATLNFFINTSNVISDEFYDFETKEPLDMRESCINGQFPTQNCVQDQGDRYLIVPEGRSFQYEIDAYYEPDIVQDTGFIVIFNSQSVDFSLEIDGETVYAKTDYTNQIILPKGAAWVSYAPSEPSDGFKNRYENDEGRAVLEWEFINRQMDSKHDPVLISVTYTYDEIFLAFNEQVYQNDQQQQRRQEEINRLNLIQQSFVIIATFAIIASLFSVLFAYLLARRKFEPELDRAKELPKREARDIEDSESLKVPIKSLFLSGMILLPMLFGGPLIPVADGQINEADTIDWKGTYDLRKDLTLTESIEMVLPVDRDNLAVYTNTSEAKNFQAFDEFGNQLNYETFDNYFLIKDPGFEFSYSFDRPYSVSNISNMLVFLDRFWLEFFKPQEFRESDDLYFHVDLTYSVILPQDAILYSASPSDKLDIDRSNGRYNVTFTDNDRQMDAFHDVWETQVTFSYVSVLDALENLDSDFQQIRAEEQNLNSLIRVAAQEVLLFSILGLIAPLISFLIAYWVFRRKYMKEIERTEQEQEERIFIESPQVSALAKATSSDSSDRLYEAFKGHYWRVMDKLSKIFDRDATRLDKSQILMELDRRDIRIDRGLLMEVISNGEAVQEGESVGYEQVSDYARRVDEVLDELNR